MAPVELRSAPEETARTVRELFGIAGEVSVGQRHAAELVGRILESFARVPGATPGLLPIARFYETAIPDAPQGMCSYLEDLAEDVVKYSTRTSSPRFLGHMTSALPYFVRPLAELIAETNQNVVKVETARSMSLLERQALAMMHRAVYELPDSFYRDHVQDPASTLGIGTSGGTMANLTALWCARNRSLGAGDGFGGVESEGLPAALHFHGYEDAVIVGSALMHYSFDKAAGVLGIGTRNLLKVPVDREQRVDARALRRIVRGCQARRRHIIAVVGIAGTTDAGSVDPLPDLAEIAREAGAHFHVDAAWGGPLIFSEQHRSRLAGIEWADSVTIDGHKQLYLPIGLGMLLFRDPAAARAIEKHARYILREGSADLGQRSLEGSRPGMIVFLHAALKLLGRNGYAYLVDEGIRKARYMADAIRAAPEYELLAEPQTNIVLYRYVPEALRDRTAPEHLTDDELERVNAANVRLQEAQWNAGTSFISRTMLPSLDARWRETVALRAVIANPLTSEADIDALLSEQVQIALGFDDPAMRYRAAHGAHVSAVYNHV